MFIVGRIRVLEVYGQVKQESAQQNWLEINEINRLDLHTNSLLINFNFPVSNLYCYLLITCLLIIFLLPTPPVLRLYNSFVTFNLFSAANLFSGKPNPTIPSRRQNLAPHTHIFLSPNKFFRLRKTHAR